MLKFTKWTEIEKKNKFNLTKKKKLRRIFFPIFETVSKIFPVSKFIHTTGDKSENCWKEMMGIMNINIFPTVGRKGIKLWSNFEIKFEMYFLDFSKTSNEKPPSPTSLQTVLNAGQNFSRFSSIVSYMGANRHAWIIERSIWSLWIWSKVDCFNAKRVYRISYDNPSEITYFIACVALSLPFWVPNYWGD